MKKSILGCAVAAVLVNASNTIAGGLWLNEYGDFSGGRASAGAGAGLDGAESIIHNPASSTRLKGNTLFASGGVMVPDIKFDLDYTTPELGTGNGGQAGETPPGATAAYVYDLNSERWSTGLYMVGLAGAGLDYDDDWAGRYQATEVTVLLAAIVPTLAYKVTDRLSVVAVSLKKKSNLNVHMDLPHAEHDADDLKASVNGDDTGFAFTLGTMYELTDRTRFGLTYQSEVKAKYDGDLKVVSPVGDPVPVDISKGVSVKSELDFAEFVRFAMHHRMDDKWAVNLTLGWDNWSQLGDVPLATASRGGSIPTKWRDTYHYAWGVEYQLDKRWAFTSGVSYDTNPVDKENRNAQLPVDRQIHLAFGTRYAIKETLTVGGYVVYQDLGKSRIASENFGGQYRDNSVVALAANVNWTF